MKTYTGKRLENGQTRVTVDGKHLNWRCNLRNHSPSGLEWGYGGSGPAQLALALLVDHFRDDPNLGNGEADEKALQFYQGFKFHIVASLAHDGWTLQTDQIDRALAAILKEDEERDPG